MNGFEVLNGGILTLVQDSGRFGYASLGVSNSGVMDEYAYHYANKLLDNPFGCNILEIAFTQLCLKATANTMISLCGADLSFSINNKQYKPWQSFYIKKGDVLKFNKSITGQRAYLSVKGGFNIKEEFGSCSTTIKEGLGGLNGKALKKGDFLPFKESSLETIKRLKQIYQDNYSNDLTLRVLLGYQYESFENNEKEKFFNNTFTLSNESNRMGAKLEGEKIIPTLDGIISEGISFGSIQIPKSGQIIILLKECQTIGGYVKIGSVLGIDCFKLSQAKAGKKINFKPITEKEAVKKTKAFYRQFL